MLSECVIWPGYITAQGYGRFHDIQAHRIVWEQNCGAIPAGLCVLHRCDVKACVNVEHLFLGTTGDNNRDRAAKGRSANALKTACLRGHSFNLENTYFRPSGARKCRACARTAANLAYDTARGVD